MQKNATSPLDEAKEQTFQATDGKKNTRHARWTREETIVLIQAKLAIEKRVGARNRSSDQNVSVSVSVSKWDSVSSYCKQHGVRREPVQCQKRWSNLLVDFKKIKTWESQIMKEDESFWKLTSDFRREIKLPGLFDRQVYDILDGNGRRFADAVAATPLAQLTVTTEMDNDRIDQEAAAEEDQVNEEKEANEESGQANEKEAIATRSPLKTTGSGSPISGEVRETCPCSIARRGSMIQEGLKRRRLSMEGSKDISWGKVLERNSNMINSQLEAQNKNYQLDRDQRKEQADSLVHALNKLTDALVKIANKL
ncbi:hypothetical protein CCACVL1_05859 [Corchorus capsularis]|uniref:Myb-like domain-containing protein n=1 Tax=Corchorus capsularis TaxID=210143 RepID=A0A1R3JIS4_COCAP|nr:hypothetical protein CCACVL1_05859 [Corchorus capsularis]